MIEALSSRLELHGLDNQINIIDSTTECDLTGNDSDSAVVLEDIDDCSSLVLKRKSCSSDVVRSISDVIQMPRRTNLQKSNCYLRRPDILETVYSVEEDPDQTKEEQQSQQQSQEPNQSQSSSSIHTDVAEKRDKFRNRSDKRVSEAVDDSSDSISISTNQSSSSTFWEKLTSYYDSRSSTPVFRRSSDDDASHHINNNHTLPQRSNQMMNYNRVMSNHRSVTKPKDVKYKRINKAKSKSLEELRGKLKNWVEHRSSGSYNVQQESRTYEDA